VDVIGKPSADQAAGLEAMGAEIAETVYAASMARVAGRRPATAAATHLAPLALRARAGRALIAIGSSTGGTEALRQVFEAIPENLPPIAVVQHMLPGFTPAFADRLDRSCRARVKVAEDGEALKPGTVYLAPNEVHLAVARGGAGLVARLQGSDRVSRHLPSVDVLFQSVAETCGHHALGVILTGMGDDGARGLLQMRQKGARTLGQDEATCVVYGMPRAAWLRGAVEEQAPLSTIAGRLVAWCERAEA
jgi:two-component system chemotaxis response regulator CheB